MESKNSRDIQNQKFDTSFRGYDKSQVDNYLKLISKEFEIKPNDNFKSNII